MKKLLLISLLVILGLGVASGLFAQATVTIGEGTTVNTTTGSPTPYGTYYKNFHQQYLLRASEIEDAGGGAGNINSIAFNVDNINTISAMPNYTIKLKQTTQTELTTTFEVGTYTTVWTAAEFTPVAGWNTHTFTTPFAWNGSANIIVDIVTTLIPGAYTQNASVFYTPTTYNSALRNQSDTVDAATSLTGTVSLNRCNIRFNMAALVVTNPPNPANLASPANGATLVTLAATLNWLSGGGVPTGYKLSLGTNNPPTNILNYSNLGMVNSYDPPGNLLPATTYYWKVTPFNANGDAPNCPVWSFTTHGDPTVTALPYTQNWDAVTAPAYPFDWTTIVQSTVTYAYVNLVTTNPQSAPNCVSMYNSSDLDAQLLLVGPQIGTSLSVNTIRVKFWAKGSAAYHLLVGVMSNPTDPATFVTVQDVNAIANWNEYTVNLTPYTGAGRYIAFKHASTATYQSIYVDGISYELIAPDDLGATTITGNSTPSVNAVTNYTVGLQNWGTAAQSTYTVKLMSGTTELASVAGPTIAAGAIGSVQIAYTPTVEGPMSIYGKVGLTGDANSGNDQTTPMNITVMPAGIAVVTIGTGDLAEGVPFEFYFKNSLFEALYYPSEIGMFGNITALTFYNNFITDLPNKPIKIWLGSTQLADLSGGWILPDQLTLVYDGTANFPIGTNSITIPLQAPYSYSGGNLVLYANRPMDTAFFSPSDNFLAQTVGTNRALKLYSDSVTYDPAAPGVAGTLSGTFPKTTLHMTPLSPDPLFVVNPDSYNYNTVLMNATTDKVFNIMNAGGGTLNVSAISISGSPFFTLQGLPTLPANLGTGQTAPFTVRYNPTAAGVHTATVSITDGRMVHTVQITGTSVDATIYTLPYAQNFDTVIVPAMPLGWSSIYQATGTTYGYVKTIASSPQSMPNCVAMYNPTDINTTAILVSQPLSAALATNTVRVKFYGKGTNYAVKVGVMTNPNDATTFQELQTVTMTAAWAQYAVPLTPYTGAGKYIAFKHGNVAVGQTLYLDDVSYEVISPNDLAALSLTGDSTPSVGASVNYTVTVFNNGTSSQSAYSVKLYNSANVELATAAGTTVAAGAQVTITLAWTPTVEGATSIYGKVILAGDVNPANDQTPIMNVTVLPGGVFSVTIGDGSQSARMPIDMYYKNSVYQTLYYPDEIGMFGNISVLKLYTNFTSTTLVNKPTKIWIGTTQQADLSAGWIPASEMTLVFDGTMNYPVGENTITFPLSNAFTYSGGNLVIMWNRPIDTAFFSSTDYFKCQTVGTNRARNIYNDTTIYDPNAMTGGSLTGQFPQITLTMSPMGVDPIFNITPTTYNFGDVTLSGTASKTFTIRNVGGGSLQINSINIAGSSAFTLVNLPTLPVSLAIGQNSTFNVNFSPTSQTTQTATVTIVDNLAGRTQFGFGSAQDRERTSHTVTLNGAGVNDITIGDGATNARMPLDMYYKNSLYETIITASEMSNFIGMINGIKLYNQFTTNLIDSPTKIWIGTTTQTDLATDWIPSTQLTQVFDGTVTYPSGPNTISINFPQPYMYLNGQNLVIMFNRPLDTDFYSSSDYFKCQTVGTNRAREMHSDTVEYDPTAPTDGTVTGQFPKITFVVTPGNVGTITGTILGAGNTPLAGVAVNVANRDYNATTDVNGQFTIPNVLPNNYSISLSKYGYVTHSQNIVVEEEETEVINVTMNPMATVNVTGTILASDTGNGLSGATISLTGYQNYTGNTTATGTFSIPNVFASQSYSYVILAAGYTTANGIVNVGTTNNNMGSITLSEVAYAPFGVVAALNITQTAANITWQAPDPSAVDITESFEADTFPPATWTQVINNTGTASAGDVYPTWCSFGTTTYNTAPAVPTDGVKQAGLWWTYEHQDEWLITPAFNCPPAAQLRFSTFAFRGSVYNDHYYVKVSINGGTDWTVLWDATAQSGGFTATAMQVSLPLEIYGGQQIKIAFHAEDPPTDDGLYYGWFIDNIIIGNQATTMHFAVDELITKSAAQTMRTDNSFQGLSRAALQTGYRSEPVASEAAFSRASRTSTRTLTGYKVWRLRAGEEENPNVWTLVTPETITPLAVADTEWGTLPNGNYRWAVKAIYTAGVASVPSLSNPIAKTLEWGNVVGVVRKPNTQPLAGVTVSTGSFSTTTNTVGAYSLALPVGSYTISYAATGYVTMNFDNINIVANQNTTNNVNMAISANEDDFIPVTVTALNGNFPNPFNPETVITYSLKEAGEVRLEIFNLKGQLIRSLVNGTQNTGNYRVLFDARDDNGRLLASGIYLYRLSTGKYTSTRKMMLME